jgi:hypothetical protein
MTSPKSDNENEHSSVHPVHKRLLKKLENHVLSITLHYMHYNFCRIHKTLRVTPAMAAGVTDRVLGYERCCSQEAPVAKRGPYKKRAARYDPAQAGAVNDSGSAKNSSKQFKGHLGDSCAFM